MPTLNKIVPCLWYDKEAEEAARFYLLDFLQELRVRPDHALYARKDSRSTRRPEGSVMTVTFYLRGRGIHGAERRADLQVQRSGLVRGALRQDQAEIDDYWDRQLGRGRRSEGAGQCGWLEGQTRSLVAGRVRRLGWTTWMRRCVARATRSRLMKCAAAAEESSTWRRSSARMTGSDAGSKIAAVRPPLSAREVGFQDADRTADDKQNDGTLRPRSGSTAPKRQAQRDRVP